MKPGFLRLFVRQFQSMWSRRPQRHARRMTRHRGWSNTAAEILEERCLLTTLSVSDVTMAEGNNGTTAFVFNVSLDQPVGQDVTFDFNTVNVTAVAGEDFVPINGNGRIPAGQTQTTIQVQVQGDTVSEVPEQFFVELSKFQPIAEVELNPAQIVRQTLSEIAATPAQLRANGVAVSGGFAFVADGSLGLRVFDVSDPASITEVGGFNSSSGVIDVTLDGNLAYVAGGNVGLFVLDVSDPANIQQVGAFDTPGAVVDVKLVGNLAYVGDANGGLRLLDVSDPANIQELGSFDPGSQVFDVEIVGNLAFVAAFSNNLRILDVGDPANIQQVGGFFQSGVARDVAIDGNLAYVADSASSRGLQVYDVSDPGNVRRVGQFELPFAVGVELVGNLAYVLDDRLGLVVLDVTDSANIQQVGAFDVTGAPRRFDLAGDKAYVAADGRGLRVLDVSDPANVEEVGSFDPPEIVIDVQVVDGLAYAADNFGGLRVFDVSDPRQVREVANFQIIGAAVDVELVGELLYITAANRGLRVLDVSDLSNIREIGSFQTGDIAQDVEVIGNLAYVADSFNGLRVLDVSDPTNIREIGGFRLGFGASAFDVELVGNLAYIAALEMGLQILDVSDPSNIRLVGMIDTPSFARDVELRDNLAFVSDSASGVRVYDVSDPANIRELSVFDTPNSAFSLELRGHLAYVADGNGGLRVLDISELSNIRKVAAFDTPGTATMVELVGGLAYIADGAAGIRVLDLGIVIRATGTIRDDDFPQSQIPVLAVGTDAGVRSQVRVYNEAGVLLYDLFPYDGFTGGVRVAMGDVTGDDVTDVITAAGAGAGPHIKVFDGRTGQFVPQAFGNFFAYDARFSGGVFVAAADLNNDGFSDIITGAGEGGGPHVRAFSGRDGASLHDFFAYDLRFTGGVRVAAGDVNGDNRPDIITGAGPGGGPHVRVFDGTLPAVAASGINISGPRGSFFAYPVDYTGGVFVAANNTDNPDAPVIVTGSGTNIGPGASVRIFNSPQVGTATFQMPNYRGVRVAVLDFNRDGINDYLTATGPGTGGQAFLFSGNATQPPLPIGEILVSGFPFGDQFLGGIFVAGSI